MNPSPLVLLVQAQNASANAILAHLSDGPYHGVVLECVETVEEALVVLGKWHAAAILIDLDLAQPHALDGFVRLHLTAPESPIIVFAETVSLEEGLAAVRAGAQDCLTRAEVESPRIGVALAYAIERQAIRSAAHMHTEQLQFSEARFRSLINENADAIVVLDSAGVIQFANPAAGTLFAKRREELIGATFQSALAEDGKTIEVPRGRDTALAQMRVVETLWNGETVQLVTLRDVTALEHVTEALRENQARYGEFIALSSEGIWRLDFCPAVSIVLPVEAQVEAILYGAVISECNDAMARMYGCEAGAELVGRATYVNVMPDDPVNRGSLRAFIQNGYRTLNSESHALDRYGNPKIFLNNIYGIVREDALIAMWGTQRDVTAEEQSRKELERTGLQEQYQRKLAQALADSAVALNSTLSFEQVLDRILDNVGSVVPHDAASIFLIEGDVTRMVRGRGFEERGLREWTQELRLRVNDLTHFRTMVETQQAYVIPAIREDSGWLRLGATWVESYVGVPLCVRGQVIGFLNVDSATPHFYNAQHAADLQAFAAQAATALENARLLAEAQARAQEFSTLYDLTGELAVQKDLDTLLNMLVERTMKLLNAPVGGLTLYLAETQELEARVVRGELPIQIGTRVRMGEGMIGHVALTREPLVVDDYRTWRGRVRRLGDENIVSGALTGPMLYGGELVGTLSVYELGDTARRFTKDEAQLLMLVATQAAGLVRTARLHAETQRRADENAALYDLTRELALEHDLDALLDALVAGAMRLLNVPCGVLGLYVPDERVLEPRIMIGTPYNEKLGGIKLGEGLMGRVALLRQPVVVQDYPNWEYRLHPSNGNAVSAVVGVPMLFGGELVGVLAVHEQGETTRHFTQAEVELLTLLATQGAAMVHNARLHQETERRAHQMSLLYDAGLALNSVLEPKAQLDFLTQIAMRSVHAERAVFFRFQEAARELVLEFSLGFTDQEPYQYLERVPLDAPQGVEAWVARERMPVTLNDAPADPRFYQSDDRILSGVWVPIEHDNRLLGVLVVCSPRPNAFNLNDERLLLLYASQAAVAMENARLYQQALEANERRTILHQASQDIVGAGLDAERVYLAIHRAVSRLMPCEAFVIAVLDEKGEWIELPYLFDRDGRLPVGRIPKTRGLSGHMLQRGSSLLIDDLASSRLDVINFGYPVPVTSLLAAPLRHGGRVFGMLSAQSYRHAAYTADDRVMLEMLAAHAAAALANVRGAETMLQELERAYLETALALAKTIDTRDSYTGAHSDRISDLAVAVAREMQLSEEETYALRLGARLHDIGKIGVPDEILRKSGALDEAEWTLMKRHPEIGAEILSLVRPLQNVIPIVKYHQEHFDGSGYPEGLKGAAIPLGARILAVVDAFSAMTDDRAYRKGRSVEEAIAELRAFGGTQFDPQVVETFVKLLSEIEGTEG